MIIWWLVSFTGTKVIKCDAEVATATADYLTHDVTDAVRQDVHAP